MAAIAQHARDIPAALAKRLDDIALGHSWSQERAADWWDRFWPAA